jgi:hypothetical protein
MSLSVSPESEAEGCFCGMAVRRNDAARLMVLDERHAGEADAGVAQMWAHKACIEGAIRPSHRYFPWDEE